MDRDLAKNIPWHHRQAPTNCNDHRLDHLNEKARLAGRDSDVFVGVWKLEPDTGEKFLSKHLTDQLQREKEGLVGLDKRCMCELCGNNPVEISGRPLVLEEVPLEHVPLNPVLPTVPEEPTADPGPDLTQPVVRCVPQMMAPMPQPVQPLQNPLDFQRLLMQQALAFTQHCPGQQFQPPMS